MEYKEIWAVAWERLDGYFREELEAVPPDRYVRRGCTVRLEALPDRRVGPFAFPQTRVVMTGRAEDVAEVRRRFLLRFASAGG